MLCLDFLIFKYRFLTDVQTTPVRFTNTFRSSVIPGQERDLSNTTTDRGVKLYSQDRQYYTNESQRAAVQVANKERAKSAVPVKTQDNPETHAKSISFFELMNTGGSKLRNTNTFKSQVFPLTQSMPDLHKIDTGRTEKQSAIDKWAVDKDKVIPEKINKDFKKTSEMYKMYLGLNDTPFQRHFKELYGDKFKAQDVKNVKKQRENLGQTVSFNQYSNKKDLYKDLDANGRRAKEFDSCLWEENNGNYKAYDSKNMSPKKTKTDISASTSWTSKEAARAHDNKNRVIDTRRSVQENLSSAVLPMDEYKAPEHQALVYDPIHQVDHRRELAKNTKNPSRQKMMVTNSNWNDARNAGLTN